MLFRSFVGESAWRAAHPEVARLGLREGLRTAPGVSVWPAVVATSSVGTGLAGLVVAGATLLYASRVDIVTVAALGVGSAVVTASLGWVATRRAVDSAPTLRGRVDAGIPLWVAGLTAAFAIAPLAGGLVQLLTRPPFDVDLGPYPSLAIGLLADLVLAPVLVIAGAGVAELGWWVARRR